MPDARVEVWNAANTSKLGELWVLDGSSRQRNFDDIAATGWKLNEAGSGGVTVQQDHPSQALLTAGNVVRLCAGSTPLFAWRVVDRTTKNITKVPSELVHEISGDGLLADWQTAVVGPWTSGRPISQDRVFNWASPPLDTSSWLTTLFIQSRAGVDSTWPRAYPVAPLFTAWVLARTSSGSQPVGDSLFRRPFTLDADAMVGLYLAADDSFDVWIDGVLLDRNVALPPDRAGFEETWRAAVPCSAGTHHLAVKVTNWGGPSALLGAAFTITSDLIDEPLFSTNGDVAGGWLGLDYPTPKPGFTAPQITQMLLTEAQARGRLTGWSISVHGTHSPIEEFATRLGTKYSDVLDALSAGWVDLDADPTGLTLHLYPKDDMGSVTGVSPSIKDLETVDRASITNAVMGVWADGVRWRSDATSISTYGRREGSLSLGSMKEPAAVDAALDAYLEANAYPTVSIVGETVDGVSTVAGIDYTVGDTVTVAGTPQRCSGLTWTVERSGVLKAMPEWDSPLSIRRRERERAYERQVAMFDSPASASILSADPLAYVGRPDINEWSWSWSDDIEGALNDVDPDKPWQVKEVDRIERLWTFMIECDPNDLPDAWGDTTVTIFKNGTELNSLYRVKLTTSVAKASTWIWGYESIAPGDRIQVACTEAGGHVDGTITLKRAGTP